MTPTPETEDYPGLDELVASVVGSEPVEVSEIDEEAAEAPQEPSGEGDEEPDASPAPAEEPSPEPSQADPEALHGAYSALYRDGLPKTVIDKMSEEEVLAYGSKAKKRQDDADAAYRERDQLRNSTKGKTAEETEEPATAQATGDTSTVLREAIATLGEQIGEDEAAAVQHVLDVAFERMILPKMQEQMSALDGIAMRVLQREVQAEMPELAKAEVFTKVRDQALALMSSDLRSELPPLDRLIELIKVSAKLEGLGAAPSVPDPRKRNGHLESGGARVPREEMPETHEEKMAAKARAIVGGETDPVRLRRKYG